MTFTASKPKQKIMPNGFNVQFTTSVLKNGVVVAQVRNRGTGGCDEYTFIDTAEIDNFIAEAEKLNATLPDADLYMKMPKKYANGEPGGDFCCAYLESLMTAAENAHARAAGLAKDCKKHVCALMPGKDHSKGYTIFKNVRPTEALVAQLRAKYPGIKILNPGVEA